MDSALGRFKTRALSFGNNALAHDVHCCVVAASTPELLAVRMAGGKELIVIGV